MHAQVRQAAAAYRGRLDSQGDKNKWKVYHGPKRFRDRKKANKKAHRVIQKEKDKKGFDKRRDAFCAKLFYCLYCDIGIWQFGFLVHSMIQNILFLLNYIYYIDFY